MALKYRYQKKEEIPAEHVALYVERNGGFELDAEGAVPAEALQAVNARLETALIDDGVVTAARVRGLREAVVPDLQARARRDMRMVDRELVKDRKR